MGRLAPTVLFPCALLVLLSASAGRAQEAKAPVVEDGKSVSVEYTLTLDDGTKVESNVGGEPLVYTQGSPEVLPALQAALAGMKVDESRRIDLKVEQAYGQVNPQLFQEVAVEMVPADAREPGTLLMGQDDAGNQRPVRVHEVKADRIVLDLNHPLAGKALHFDVKVLAIR
jgi:FKBP-type peptidyl-prolyl cis-trans isomerase 2